MNENKQVYVVRILASPSWFVSILLWMKADSIGAEKLPLDKIQLPPGFEISLYAEVPGARSMSS